MSSVERRLAALEARLTRLRPPPTLPEAVSWIRWTSHDDLDRLEQLAYALEIEGRPLTAAEQLAAIEIEARSTRAMLAGEPPS